MTLEAPRPLSATIDTKTTVWTVTFDRPVTLTGDLLGANFAAEWKPGAFHLRAEAATPATVSPDGLTVTGSSTGGTIGGTHDGHVLYAASPPRIVSADLGIPADPFAQPATVT